MQDTKAAVEENDQQQDLFRRKFALQRQREQRAAAEQQVEMDQQEQLVALQQGFAPDADQLDIHVKQAAAFRSGTTNRPYQDVLEEERLDEGSRRAGRFRDSIKGLSPLQLAEFGVMAAGLQKEGLQASEYRRILEAVRASQPLDKFSSDQLDKANRIYRATEGKDLIVGEAPVPNVEDVMSTVTQQIIAVHGQADPVLEGIAQRMAAEGQTAEDIIRTLDLGEGGQRGFLPLGPASEEVGLKLEEATVGAEQVLTGIGEVGIAAVEAVGVIPEAAFEISREVFQGDLAGAAAEAREAGGATVTNILQAWEGIQDIFEGEQRIFTPFTQPLIRETLITFGVPEGVAATIAKYTAEFAVPTTFLPGGALLGKGKKLWQIGRTLLAEGSLNVLQNRAGREVRGEDAPDIKEDLLVFTAGMAGRGALELAGQAGGKLVSRFLADDLPVAVRPAPELVPTARGAPLEVAAVRRPPPQIGDSVALRSDPSVSVGTVVRQEPDGLIIRPSEGGRTFVKSRGRVQVVEGGAPDVGETQVLYHGVDTAERADEILRSGFTSGEDAFLSTDPDLALRFGSRRGGKSPTVLEIEVPAGVSLGGREAIRTVAKEDLARVQIKRVLSGEEATLTGDQIIRAAPVAPARGGPEFAQGAPLQPEAVTRELLDRPVDVPEIMGRIREANSKTAFDMTFKTEQANAVPVAEANVQRIVGSDPTVRLYRGITKEGAEFPRASQGPGNWWSTDPARAERFAGRDGTVFSLDAKASELANPRLAGTEKPLDEWFIEQALASRAKVRDPETFALGGGPPRQRVSTRAVEPGVEPVRAPDVIAAAIERGVGPTKAFPTTDLKPLRAKAAKANNAVNRATKAHADAPRGQKGARLKELQAAKKTQRETLAAIKAAERGNKQAIATRGRMATRVVRGRKAAKVAETRAARAPGGRRDVARAQAEAAEGRAKVLEDEPELVERLTQAVVQGKKAVVLSEAEVAAGRRVQAAGAQRELARVGTLEERLARSGEAIRGKIKPDITGEVVQVSAADKQALTDAITDFYLAKNQPLSGRVALEALDDVLGGNLGNLTKSKLERLGEALGSDFQLTVLRKASEDLSIPDNTMASLLTAYNLPRVLLAGLLDWSFLLRQGVFAAITSPRAWAKAAGAYPRSFAGRETAERLTRELLDDDVARYFRDMDLAMPVLDLELGGELALLGRERGWAIKQLKRTPILGDMLDRTDRSARIYLSKLRQSQAEQWVVEELLPHDVRIKFLNASKRADQAAILREHFADSEEPLRKLMGFVNETSGRGTLGPLDKYLGPLNFIFFAPRFVAGQVTRFRYAFGPGMPLAVRKIAINKLLRFYGTVGGALMLIKSSGLGDVELDPRSTDFMKIKIGNSRIDITGGAQPLFRYMAQIATGQRKPDVGDIQDADRLGSLLNFWRSKMAPTSGLIWSAIEGETFIGEELTLKTLIADSFMPIFMQDIQEAFTEGGTFSRIVSLLGFAGVGVQTYETRSAASARIIEDMIERGMIDARQYDDLPVTIGDLLPEDLKEFRGLAPDLTRELEESTELTIERSGERTQRAFLGELSRLGRDQVQRGVQAAADIFTDTRDGAGFRDGVDTAVLRLRGLRSVLQEEREKLGLEAREREGPVFTDLESYFDIFDRFPNADFDPQQRVDMFDDIERFFAGIGAAREADVETQLGLNLEEIPEYARLKTDRRTIREAGWFDLGQDVWDELRRRHPELRLPEQRRDHEIQVGQNARGRFPDDRLRQDLVEDADPVLKVYAEMKQAANEQWYARHPEILLLLDRWGYREFAQGDLELLAPLR